MPGFAAAMKLQPVPSLCSGSGSVLPAPPLPAAFRYDPTAQTSVDDDAASPNSSSSVPGCGTISAAQAVVKCSTSADFDPDTVSNPAAQRSSQ